MRPRFAITALCALMILAGVACGEEGAGRLPAEVLQEVQTPGGLPEARYVPAGAWEAEAPEMAHRFGRAVADPDASGGRAWEATAQEGDGSTEGPAVSGDSGIILYGPYARMEPGSYVAFFRLKLVGGDTEEGVADVDACVGYGQNILAVREVAASDLPQGRYVLVPLAFQCPGGVLETRVLWRGFASLRVDRVLLFRVEGASFPLSLIGKVPQPQPSGLPRNLVYRPAARPFPEIFPRSAPPAERLLVVDLRRLAPDWQLCLLTLQGLVNRSQPRLYCLFNDTDPEWLAWMQRRGWVKGTESVSAGPELIARFRDTVKGVVVTDPKLPATRNVATMLAGVKNCLAVSPRLVSRVGLPVVDDLRGRWRTSVEAYQWAFDTLWPKMNHHLAACSWPDHLGLRDYLVQHRVFIFWLPGPIDGARRYSRPAAEVQLVERILARLPANVPLMSYPWAGKDVGIGEGPGVTLFAEFGKYLVGSINCSNLSVHSGIRNVQFRQRRPVPPPLLRDRVYVAIVISDGDNLPVLTTHNFPQLWKSPLRGRFPIGWTMTPSAHMLIPAIADYYYQTATPQDCFLTGVSGVGYTYADHYAKRFRAPDRLRVLDGFLAQTRETMARMDLKEAWVMGVTRPELIRRYATQIPFLEGLYPDYGRRLTSYEEAVYPTARGVPVFHAACNWREGASREEQIEGVVSHIRAMTPKERPAFLHLFVLNWFCDLPMLESVLRRLGPEYVAVRPDHMAALFRQEMARREVLARMPSTLAGIEGERLVFGGTVHNTSGRPLAVRARVAAGMANARVTPALARMAPGSEVTLAVSGVPRTGSIALRFEGGSAPRQASLACRQVRRAEIIGPLPEHASLRFALHLEAEDLPSNAGSVEADAQASGGKARSSDADPAKPGHLAFGPYTPVKAGRYLALFRLKRTGTGSGRAAVVDSCVGGGVQVTAQRPVPAGQLPIGQYRYVALVFRHPGGPIETRVFWPGQVPVSVDQVLVWEILPR